MKKQYQNIQEFYHFYLSQHRNKTCRTLHFIGTTIVILILFDILFISHNWVNLFLLPVAGYGFAWLGHFKFEKNKPATFDYPWYSLCCDFIMYKDMLLGKIKIIN